VLRPLLISALALFGLTTPALTCSAETPCEVADGSYHIAFPEDPGAGDLPAVVFIHGFGGSGAGVFRNTGMVSRFLDRGYAVVAPNGLARAGRNGGSWSFHPGLPNRRDEIAFITAVRDDLIASHDIDPDRIILSGFSIGGSMASYLACQEPEAFSAYAPLGGSFWREHPDGCEGPVRLLHTHGWRDGTVPLEGRNVRGGAIGDPEGFSQGDVFHAMEIWREANGCIYGKADSFDTKGDFWIRKWERCAEGSALEFALFPGGHIVPEGWADLMLDWFEAL